MKRVFIALACLISPTVGLAQSSEVESTFRRDVFSVGVSGNRHSLKAGDGNEVLGNSAMVQLGKGYVANTWFWNASFDLHLGPYEPSRNRQLDVDYVGTGISAWVGTSAQNSNLRSPEGGYGFALGFSYADVVGRSVGKNRRSTSDTNDSGNDDLIDNYSIRITNFSLIPSLFFCWLKEPRPRGNSPDLLKTRLDGYILSLGIAMPLLVSYKAKYDTRTRFDNDRSTVLESGATEYESGQLRGYSINVALSTLLGT